MAARAPTVSLARTFNSLSRAQSFGPKLVKRRACSMRSTASRGDDGGVWLANPLSASTSEGSSASARSYSAFRSAGPVRAAPSKLWAAPILSSSRTMALASSIAPPWSPALSRSAARRRRRSISASSSRRPSPRLILVGSSWAMASFRSSAAGAERKASLHAFNPSTISSARTSRSRASASGEVGSASAGRMGAVARAWESSCCELRGAAAARLSANSAEALASGRVTATRRQSAASARKAPAPGPAAPVIPALARACPRKINHSQFRASR